MLFPSNPAEVMVIRSVTPDIITMSLPFARFGLIKFGGRGTLVRMKSGSLAVFSPVGLTTQVRETVDSMGGRVKYIAAPDMEHHLLVGAWKKAYPDAEIIAPEGLWEKRQGREEFKEEAPFKHVFRKESYNDPHQTVKVDEEFDAEFETEYVYGHGSRELVFLHKPSRTVIEADLLFNLPAWEQYSRTSEGARAGLWTRLMTPLMSTQGAAVWQQRFAWYILSKADRGAFTRSMRRIETWDFDRLVPCHGDVIETGAKAVFRKVFAWFLE
ncbi:hypothetical protein ASPZODRAFT_130337 [Penicilliopsis zonata CBS 506.65]|uniref:Metallo-beta-lactamase domain-containing protein n=1 Tax=Penicilliopsis zonata CBS 506.65 TaxID=1073090 RepID=A0A1L9SM93_9EURO|nr:hypothetical protein ASPZODRAFT_130337 [Penicilliopsis zonata CBS 506.65]OJJ48345.1 hypothetical protein ASPZODRAFT_130337 [Penicilliopsis zonata CBS 506.65]